MKTKTANSSDAPLVESKVASLVVDTMPLASLKPHPRNPRKHPAKDSPEWKVLEASLKHDYFDPIVWNVRNGQLVSGHLRTKVLLSMGYEKADVVVVDYDEPTHIARLMAANKAIGENDLPKMQELFGELKTVEGFDMAMAGFTLPEVDDLFSEGEAAGDEDNGEVGATAGGEESSEVTHADLSNAIKNLEQPHIEAAMGEHWLLGGVHHLFVRSMVKPPFPWAPILSEPDPNGRETRFIPCPDLTVSLTEKDVRLVMLCPAPLTASFILSVYAKVKGDAAVQKLEA